MVRYRNKNTKQVVAYPEPDSRLEALPNWERLDDEATGGDVAPSAAAYDRAEAERASIAAAQGERMQDVELRADVAAQIAAASAASPLPDTPANVTLAHQETGAYRATTSVLERAKADAARLGPGLSEEELQARAAADSQAIHALGNEGGVLARQHGFIQQPTPAGTASADTAAVEDETDDGAPAADDGEERPADNASTAAWVDYVVTRGLLPRDEAEGLKRKELIEKAGPAAE